MSSSRRKSASDVDQAGTPATKRFRGKAMPLLDQDMHEETCEIERLGGKHGLDNSQMAMVKVLGLLMDHKFAKMQESLESQVAKLLSQPGVAQNQSENAPSSPPMSTSPLAADEPMRGSPDESSSSAQHVISADGRPDAALGPVSGSSDALEDAEPEPLGVCSDHAGEIENELKTLRANLKAAVGSEDFETAVALQERETELQQQLDALEASKSEENAKKEAKEEARLAEVAHLQQELAAVTAEKLAAAEDEDFESADDLKDKETEIRQQLKALKANSEEAVAEGSVEAKPVSMPNEAAPPPPLISTFREATKAELAQWPQILAKFAVFMETAAGGQMSGSTRKSYVKALKNIVEYDMKAPEETASVEYRESVKFTFEDIHSSGNTSASLKWFRDFWEARGNETFEPSAGDPPVAWTLTPKIRLLGSTGDGSAESRAAVDIEGVVGGLPEGWHIHEAGCQPRWSSPNGRFYRSTRQISRKLAPPPFPGLTTPAKNRRKSLAEDVTPEPPAEPPQPLEKLLGPVGEKEKTTQEDKDLTPRVATRNRTVKDFFRCGQSASSGSA